jgi:hypothetical protein
MPEGRVSGSMIQRIRVLLSRTVARSVRPPFRDQGEGYKYCPRATGSASMSFRAKKAGSRERRKL